MNDVELSYREFYLYVIIGGAIFGALLGLIPLILGRRKNKKRLGFYGFLASIVGGAIAPLLAIVVTVVFSWLIAKGTATEPEASSQTDSNSDVDPSSN
jgi:MFS family permease